MGGEEDNRNIFGCFSVAQTIANLITIEAGHLHIEKDDIGNMALGFSKSFFAILGESRHHICRFQATANNFSTYLVVIYREYVYRSIHFSPICSS